MAGTILNVVVSLLFGIGSTTQSQPDTTDLIAKAQALVQQPGNQIWPGLSEAPFGVLLVDGTMERLFCHQGPAPGFKAIGPNVILNCDELARPASYPPDMLASFPAVAGVPTVVIGTPEATGKSEKDWILTLVHEHFHQMQHAWESYYPGTSALGLSGGDDTGMWMLNYPFPYDSPKVGDAIAKMAGLLQRAIDARGSRSFKRAVKAYWQAREAARSSVSESDWRYFELQLWQEGVARWTEVAIAANSKAFRDHATLGELAIKQELNNLNLSELGRSAVYPIGAGEALILEEFGTQWRSDYWANAFSLRPHLHNVIRSP